MRGKEILFALGCVVSGALLAVAIQSLSEGWPSPVVYYSMIVVGLGGALVTVRYGRLGPFEGELGSPGVEAGVREQLVRETGRAMRFGREFTIVAVRTPKRYKVDWVRNVRVVDQVIPCRRGLVLILLPETTVEGALMLLRRVTTSSPQPLRAAIINWPRDGHTGDELATQLLSLIREQVHPGEVVMRAGSGVMAQPIVA
jgi:hypothetical protein